MRGLLFAVAIAAALSVATRAEAAPDPVIASALSVGSTLVPIGITGILFFTGNGYDETVRFDLGMTTLALGSVFGPSIGQIYAGGGVDAWVTFFLRIITGGVMVTGTGLALKGTGEGAQTAGTALAVIGAVPTVFLAAWDVFGAAKAAKAARYREGHAFEQDATPRLASGWLARHACLETGGLPAVVRRNLADEVRALQ
jgi:hypothetical protein